MDISRDSHLLGRYLPKRATAKASQGASLTRKAYSRQALCFPGTRNEPDLRYCLASAHGKDQKPVMTAG